MQPIDLRPLAFVAGGRFFVSVHNLAMRGADLALYAARLTSGRRYPAQATIRVGAADSGYINSARKMHYMLPLPLWLLSSGKTVFSTTPTNVTVLLAS